MSALLVVVGLVLVGLALVDAVTTTLTPGVGGGPLTRRTGRFLWRLALRVAGRRPRGWLRYAGPLIVLTTVLVWALLLWAGWTLILSADEHSVVETSTGEPAGTAARAYFAGFVIVTLGVGDFSPGGPPWQVLTSVASFVGLFLVTLSITYLVSVVSAAVDRRRLAHAISAHGSSGAEVVLLHWQDDHVDRGFASYAEQVAIEVIGTTQKHLAYPVLHLFHAAEQQASAPRAVAVLDDALLLLSEGVAPEARPARSTLLPLRRALEHYAATVEAPGVDPDIPPLPDLEPLRDGGVPVVDPAAFVLAAAAHRERRTALHALVRSDTHTWPG